MTGTGSKRMLIHRRGCHPANGSNSNGTRKHAKDEGAHPVLQAWNDERLLSKTVDACLRDVGRRHHGDALHLGIVDVGRGFQPFRIGRSWREDRHIDTILSNFEGQCLSQ